MVQKFVIGDVTLYLADCMEVLSTLPDNSVDAVVTDPPYGLSFMGKRWDYDVPATEVWAECLRVLKPGGHLLAFSGTRTQHRMAVRIEDAGFEIRDMIAWVYGTGFPKSLDVSKALDKEAGVERDVIGYDSSRARPNRIGKVLGDKEYDRSDNGATITAPSTDAARQWQGWGTALKPALEPITVARKPLVGTVAENVLAHGTGALNIDGCRVAHAGKKLGGGNNSAEVDRTGKHEGWQRPWMQDADAATIAAARSRASTSRSEDLGRWPANLIHDGSKEVTNLFPVFNDNSAARFFYCAKASKSDRGDGNVHPTVKPTDLMRYLCRLVTPPGGLVLDPFMGSGSTGKAAALEEFQFIGIEREQQYFDIACKRIQNAVNQGQLFAEPVNQPEQGERNDSSQRD